MATARNQLIHGYWQMDIVVEDKTDLIAKEVEWVRFYEPTDPEAVYQMHGKRPNQKLLSVHVFKLGRILSLAKEANELGQHLSAFVGRVQLLSARVPQPVF
jgi:hypothetical protein